MKICNNNMYMALACCALLLLTSCKSEEKESSFLDKVKDTSKDISNTSKVVSNIKKSQELMKKLQQTQPLSKDDFKNWMPEKLDDLERSKFKIDSNTYVNSIKLTYKQPEVTSGKKIMLEVIDGAGNGSGVIYTHFLAGGVEVDSEDQTGYEKTLERNGIFLLETYQNENYGHQSRFKFLFGERFAINATGFKMKPDELWEYVKKLQLNNLK